MMTSLIFYFACKTPEIPEFNQGGGNLYNGEEIPSNPFDSGFTWDSGFLNGHDTAGDEDTGVENQDRSIEMREGNFLEYLLLHIDQQYLITLKY